jgi:hypothetical protein
MSSPEPQTLLFAIVFTLIGGFGIVFRKSLGRLAHRQYKAVGPGLARTPAFWEKINVAVCIGMIVAGILFGLYGNSFLA